MGASRGNLWLGESEKNGEIENGRKAMKTENLTKKKEG